MLSETVLVLTYINIVICTAGNIFTMVSAILMIIRLKRLLKLEEKHKGSTKGYKKQTLIQLTLLFIHTIVSCVWLVIYLSYKIDESKAGRLIWVTLLRLAGLVFSI